MGQDLSYGRGRVVQGEPTAGAVPTINPGNLRRRHRGRSPPEGSRQAPGSRPPALKAGPGPKSWINLRRYGTAAHRHWEKENEMKSIAQARVLETLVLNGT